MADQEHAVFRPTPKADDPGLKPTKQTPGKCPGCARQRWLPEPLPPQSRASLCLRMTFAVGQGERHAETGHRGPGPHPGHYQRMTLRNSSHQFFSLKVW